jgi:hypothetical protein
VAHALRDDLSRRFGQECGIVCESAADAGLAALRELAVRRVPHVVRCCMSPGEQVAVPRDELLDGLRGPTGDFLDGGGHAVIPILAM